MCVTTIASQYLGMYVHDYLYYVVRLPNPREKPTLKLEEPKPIPIISDSNGRI